MLIFPYLRNPTFENVVARSSSDKDPNKSPCKKDKSVICTTKLLMHLEFLNQCLNSTTSRYS